MLIKYWWRSNGVSGQSGFIHAKNSTDVRKKVLKAFKEDDIFVVEM